MNKAWNQHDSAPAAKPLDWRKRMSDTVAYALLVYTTLQIFVTMTSLHQGGGSMLPYFALIVLVIAIIPACRSFERRWAGLDDAQAADPAMARYFRRDRLIVWALALGLPFVISGMFKLLEMVFLRA